MQKNGFTLVELSIVLVILGLLVGGVLTGQSLIHAAELRKVSSDFQRYTTAVYTFRDKYFAVPGDMPNATAYWGIAGGSTGNDTTCWQTPSTDARTCNGDGDGKIVGMTVPAPLTSVESLRAWQHLANAGLIEGQYSGYPTSTTAIKAGTDIPRSPLSNGAYMFTGMNINVLTQGIVLQSAGFFYSGRTITGSPGILKMEDAYNLDKKMDDGIADTGKMLGNTYAISRVAANSCGTYDLADTSKLCTLSYLY